MSVEFFPAAGLEGIHTGIGPDIGSRSPMLAQLERIHMRRIALLEHANEFVLRAVEAALPAVGLDPDDQVLEVGEDQLAGLHQGSQVTPIDADVDDRPVLAGRRNRFQSPFEEALILLGGHLARRHRELGELDPAASARVPGHRHVEGRIRKCHLGLRTLHQRAVADGIACVAAQHAMLVAERPKVSWLRYCCPDLRDRIFCGVRRLGVICDDDVGLDDIKSGHHEINLKFRQKNSKFAQLGRQDLPIPPCVKPNTIQCESQCALFRVTKSLI